MTQPPQDPPPEGQPWQDPGGRGSEEKPKSPPQQPPQPYEQPQQQPPAYGSTYGQQQPYPQAGGPYGGLPQYAGAPGYGYQTPAAGLAGRWRRLIAGIIDLIIVGIVANILTLPFVNWTRTFNPGRGQPSISSGQIAASILTFVLAVIYYTVLHAKWSGQTVGKKALGIRLVRAEDRGPISIGQALGRAAIYEVAPYLCCVGQLVNLGWILVDPRRQALHDKAVRTVVVAVKPGDPNPYETRPF